MAQDLLLDRQQPRSDQSDGGHGVGGSVASGEDDDHLPHDTSLWRDRAIVICAMLAVVGIPVMFARAATRSGGALPFHLSIGCMLIVGWTCGRAADFFLCMPPVIGYIAFGVFFGKVEGHPMHAARSYLVSLAFLLVLMRAGLEIRPQDLNAFTVALGVLPILADGLVVGVVARRLYELSVLEAATFATVVCALGDGIIIPRMMQLAKQSHGASRQIARAVLTAAPIECTCALFAFGSCSEMLSFSRSSGEEEPPGGEHRAVGGAEGVSALSQVSLVIARLIGTLLVATAIAHVFALVLGARRLLAFPASKKTLFAGSSTEELLLTIAAAMVAYGIGAVLPMPERLHPAGRIGGGRSGAEGGLVEADLAVVVALFVFARLRPRGAVRALEEGIGALWTVAALLLFTELGANLHPPAVEPTAGGVAPTALAMFAPIAAGLCARALAYAVLCASRAAARPERMPAPHDAGVLFRLHAPVWALETLFCIAGTLPRATIQGVLGGLALQNKLVSHRVGQLIQSSAALTVLLLAPLGVFMQARAPMPPAAASSRCAMPLVSLPTKETAAALAYSPCPQPSLTRTPRCVFCAPAPLHCCHLLSSLAFRSRRSWSANDCLRASRSRRRLCRQYASRASSRQLPRLSTLPCMPRSARRCGPTGSRWVMRSRRMASCPWPVATTHPRWLNR